MPKRRNEMPNIYLKCIDCVYSKGEWSFPSKTYPCGQTACIKPNNDIPASTHIIDNKSIEALQAKIRELKTKEYEIIIAKQQELHEKLFEAADDMAAEIERLKLKNAKLYARLNDYVENMKTLLNSYKKEL